jgi:hypothetical protein
MRQFTKRVCPTFGRLSEVLVGGGLLWPKSRVGFAFAANVGNPPVVSNRHVCLGLGAAVRRHLDQWQLCAESVLCKVARTAQNYHSRWPRTLRRSFPETDIDTLL